jgi:predicted N-formylglutamate amidohydrolase
VGLLTAGASKNTAVAVLNGGGKGPFLLACEHASNHLPARFGTLGLPAAELVRHIAWDPGALPVAERMAALLDAPLVASGISRLVVDCNRPVDAPDLIWEISESTVIPGNAALDREERNRRIELAWRPFHDRLERTIAARRAAARPTFLVTIHTYTPVWKGVARPWHVGIIHDDDERLSRPLLEGLRAEPGLAVGDNEPYAPKDRVYYTLERHARPLGLPCVMIEIRNDLVADTAGQMAWAERLARLLAQATVANAANDELMEAQRHA